MKKIILLTMTLLLIASITVPAAAATTKYSLSVTNYTNKNIEINLVNTEENDEGDNDEYTLKVSRFDDNSIKVPKGEYEYSYEYCGYTKDGTIKLNQDKSWELLPCGVQPSKMRINSHFSQDLTVTMYGPLEMPEPEEQTFTVELGGNRILDILSGNYIMSYEAECSTVAGDPATVFSEEVRVLKSGKTQVMLHGCEWYDHPARQYAKPVPVKFRIINHASFPIVLQLVGPEGRLLDINPGVNMVTLIYGTYKYGYFLDHTYHTGHAMVTKNGQGTLVLRPAHIFELPGTGGSDDTGE
jgi:hypothetical protein